MDWKPDKKLGLLAGVFIALTITGIAIYLFSAVLKQPFGFSLYLTALLFLLSLTIWGIVLYRLYGLLQLSYRLDRSKLVIHYGYARTTIPLSSITRVLLGNQLSKMAGFRGFEWPGYVNGNVQLADGSLVISHSTVPFERQLIITTSQGTYGISPSEMSGFIAEIRLMLAEGATRTVAAGNELAPLAALPIWRDRWRLGATIVALVTNLLLWGLVAAIYAGLPDRLPLQFDPRGRIEMVGPKAGLVLIPVIGTMTWIANSVLGVLVHNQERFAASLLVFINLLIQVMCWIAVLQVIG